MRRSSPTILTGVLFGIISCAGEIDTGQPGQDLPTTQILDASSPARADGRIPADARPPDMPGCGEFAGASRFTCAKDGNSRGKCTNSVPAIETCPRGCLRRKAPDDDSCMGTTTGWSCTEVQGTSKAENGDYFLTSFGCWVDDQGTSHQDPGDNCSPGCLSIARTAGLCQSSWSGKTCEEKINYYTANNGRFPCLQRLRISNPTNGKKVVAVVLDGGPACWVEEKVSMAILDASSPVSIYLFGTTSGWSDRALVHVVEVDQSTPLGPQP